MNVVQNAISALVLISNFPTIVNSEMTVTQKMIVKAFKS